ncbi:hypothetical protein EMPS_06684 [Entomortierella parvispora]|uniref:Uncharacterized protein n=1 Tax=Entomortierella parvispora TaxID=205924 RepID=A0A9P3HCY8_9FUNG|nr:hypothetical protein EMPS_06684 [Entomortierella parvispora]
MERTYWCIDDGRALDESFSVIPTEPHPTVDDLKRAINKILLLETRSIDLILYKWTKPHDVDKKSILDVEKLPEKVKLDPREFVSSLALDADGTYILVQKPPDKTRPSSPQSELKRGIEHEHEDPQKRPRISEWKNYDAKDQSVELPPELVHMLKEEKFAPAPRKDFKQALNNLEVGQEITLPSIGQRPKHYGEGYQKLSFFITEQMVEMWRLLSSNSDRPIRRILSGPMGVGKSYLALFLAAKAYAEGWLLLYVSDANELALDDSQGIAKAICARFLPLNKDILTSANFAEMTLLRPKPEEVFNRAANSILHELLQQPETKTLLVIDEHGALFEQDPPIPKKHVILNQLMQLAAWRETSRGARVVLTGTAHAKFERQYVRSDMWQWLEFVTPLSDTVFDKLLHMDPMLSRPAIKDKVKEITNRVPRELVNMAVYVRKGLTTAEQQLDSQQSPAIDPVTFTESDLLSRMIEFQEQRHQAFYQEAYTYFRGLDKVQQHSHRHALAAIFLPRKEGEFDFENRGFDYQFMDLGLVYRMRVAARTEYRTLCPAAKDALLDIYRSMPLPRDTMKAITDGNPTGEQFEDALFSFLVRHSKVILDATDLAGKQKVPVVIRSNSVKFLEDPPFIVSENVLLRCFKGYPRFDYISGHTFIQVSLSDFATHNVDSANIEKAFERPTIPNTRTSDHRNQIEKHLDSAFGGQHEADINPVTRKFVVRRKELISKDGQLVEDIRAVEDFQIVYIHGKPGKPNHTGKIKDFPDVLHVSLEELQNKLFGDLVTAA